MSATDESTTLLMRLRHEGHFIGNWTATRAVNLMFDHISEFPPKVREEIRKAANEETIASNVFERVQRAVLGLLFSAPEPGTFQDGMVWEADEDGENGDEEGEGGEAEEGDNSEEEDNDDEEERQVDLRFFQQGAFVSGNRSDGEIGTQSGVALRLFQPGMSVPGNGFDSETDTKEQVEVALRFYPYLLALPGTGVVDGKPTFAYAPFWVSTSLKSLPFAPLLYKLVAEMDEELHIVPRSEMAKFIHSIIFYETSHSDEEYDRRLDEAALLSFKCLIDKGFIRKGDKNEVHISCALAVRARPSRVRKTLRYLLEWDPAVLKGYECEPNLLWCFSGYLEIASKEETLERFRMVFELGMVHYPEYLGFMFHIGWRKYELDDEGTIFERASRHLGKKRVTKMVNEVLWKTTQGHTKTIQTLVIAAATIDSDISLDALRFLSRATRGNSDAIRSLIVAVATNKGTELDALYLLCCQNPAALIPSDAPWSD